MLVLVTNPSRLELMVVGLRASSAGLCRLPAKLVIEMNYRCPKAKHAFSPPRERFAHTKHMSVYYRGEDVNT